MARTPAVLPHTLPLLLLALLLGLATITSLHAQATEICDNGIDDDGDGTHRLDWESSATEQQRLLRASWLAPSPRSGDHTAVAQESGEPIYELTLNPDTPLVGQFRLELPRAKPAPGGKSEKQVEPRLITLRGAVWGLESQVYDARGDDSPLEEAEVGKWIVPDDCKVVTWKIHFADTAKGSQAANTQQCTFFRENTWWLVAEPTAILRLDGSMDVARLVIQPDSLGPTGATDLGNGQWRIPPGDEAPEFYVVGNDHCEERIVDGFRIRYVSDNADRVSALGLLDAHGKAFHYLNRLFPDAKSVPKKDRQLLVIWIGINAKKRQLGGAAGSRSFVANYLYGVAENPGANAALNLAVLAHEQFHQLQALCVSKENSFPVWVNEGLAHYYGLKALSESGMAPQAIARTRARFIDIESDVTFGLRELARQYHGGDRSVYMLFYSQGATFWSELDNALSSATDGQKTLDDYLPQLFEAVFDESWALPPSFLSILPLEAAVDVESIVNRYVGH